MSEMVRQWDGSKLTESIEDGVIHYRKNYKRSTYCGISRGAYWAVVDEPESDAPTCRTCERRAMGEASVGAAPALVRSGPLVWTRAI